MAAPPPVVVKLGGSLWNNPNLKRWLAAISETRGGVIVPGGGPFADAVRATQPVLGFDDAAAHRMALLAMAQYAHALSGLEERLAIAEQADDFAELWIRRRTPVWSPPVMAADREDIPQSWDMTSDSLAAWLAGALGAARVILVKSAAPGGQATAGTLAARGVVDPLFPRFLAESGADAIWLGPDDWPSLPAALKGEAGARIVP
ncbi:MAG: hypothetical protein NW215_12890 [Hyphomicrobiales bacterium]|nr:hypothetical protein [Hyphomicrobiales bacterium]